VAALENYVHKYLNYYSYVDFYVCPSVFLYNKFKQFNFFNDKLVQLYHGYNYSEIDAVLQAQIPVNERYIVFVGRLEKIKGAHTVLKAIKNCPNISLKIVGSGTQEQELKQFVFENGLNNVSFEGKKIRNETLQLIKNADFLICASEWYEVLGFTVVEAMALGKPVIGSAIGAIPEMVIDNYTGLLFEPGNYAQLGNLITMLYADSDLMEKMGQNARQHITTLIDNDKHYTGLQQLVPGL
jgi:glycosyltransferase involved in cell wall biosynthesis